MTDSRNLSGSKIQTQRKESDNLENKETVGLQKLINSIIKAVKREQIDNAKYQLPTTN